MAATGGHVEIAEDPADTVRREAPEELGVAAMFGPHGHRPLFITVTETLGAANARHTDVSLWYLLAGSRRDRLHPTEREFRSARWWSPAEIEAAPPSPGPASAAIPCQG